MKYSQTQKLTEVSNPDSKCIDTYLNNTGNDGIILF